MIKETWTAKIKEIGRIRINDILSFLVHFRMVEKASEFCSHAYRLDLRHNVTYMC